MSASRLPHRCAFSQPDEKNAPRPAVGSTLSQGSLSSRQKVMRPAQTKRCVAEEAPEGGGAKIADGQPLANLGGVR
eukprot:COSAG01_NODE_8622_length_2716_cov_3.927780_4_plen_76_part_00